jgi:hypothetical protein
LHGRLQVRADVHNPADLCQLPAALLADWETAVSQVAEQDGYGQADGKHG